MTDCSDVTSGSEELRACIYCDKTGADCYIRTTATGTQLFAHEDCAKDHGVRPLLRRTKPGPTRAATYPWA